MICFIEKHIVVFICIPYTSLSRSNHTTYGKILRHVFRTITWKVIYCVCKNGIRMSTEMQRLVGVKLTATTCKQKGDICDRKRDNPTKRHGK